MALLEAGGAPTCDPRPVRSDIDPARPRASILVALLVVAPFAALLGAVVAAPSRTAVGPLQVRAGQLWLAGSPVQLRGVRYNPWLPAPGPDGLSPSLRHDLVEQDLDDIRALGANAIEVFGAPAWVADQAARRGL